jgi:hypothetical protein
MAKLIEFLGQLWALGRLRVCDYCSRPLSGSEQETLGACNSFCRERADFRWQRFGM